MNDKMFYENLSKQMQEDKEKIKELKNQQEKFINYLKSTILSNNVIADGLEDSDYKEEIMAKIRTFNEVLIVYKDIIGDSNE